MRHLNYLLFIGVAFFLSSCASLSPQFEQPQVSITSFQLAPQSTGPVPTFLVGLKVINPNRDALPINGMSYSVDIDGHRILSGAEPELPRVPGYGTVEFTIKATPDLLGSARLISQALNGNKDSFKYDFKARLDVGRLLPFITIQETGEFSLKGAKSNQPSLTSSVL